MLSRILGGLFSLGSIASWFCRETIKAWFFERVVHMSDPFIGSLVEYGPPAAFALLGLWLLGAHTKIFGAFRKETDERRLDEKPALVPQHPPSLSRDHLPRSTPLHKVSVDFSRLDEFLLTFKFTFFNGSETTIAHGFNLRGQVSLIPSPKQWSKLGNPHYSQSNAPHHIDRNKDMDVNI